jgi:hypothetical protein
MREDVKLQELDNCPRCGELHSNLIFERIVNPPHANDGHTFTHFSICPKIEQPILLRIELLAT